MKNSATARFRPCTRLRVFAFAPIISAFLAWCLTAQHAGLSSYIPVREYFVAWKAAQLEMKIENPHSITVWTSTSACRGEFVSSRNEDGPREFIVRDVVTDYRHNSLGEYRLNHSTKRPLKRIVAYLSVTPLGNGSRIQPNPIRKPHFHEQCPEIAPPQHRPTARLTRDGKEVEEFDVSVENIYGGPHQPDPCHLVWKSYRNADEWQIYVGLAPRQNGTAADTAKEKEMDSALSDLESQGTFLELSVTFRTGAQSFKNFKSSFLLGCIPGLTARTALPLTDRMFHSRPASCNQSSGALLVSGGALWGELTSPIGRVRAAHFAARALTGYLRYEAVAIGVMLPRTIAHIQHICGERRACFDSYQRANYQFMKALARDMEKALQDANVMSSIWQNIVLFPFCKLGSDFDGTEHKYPCNWSSYLGQHHYGYLSYTLFSPFVKWVTSMDIDEAIGDTLIESGNDTFCSAAFRFDSCGDTEVPGALWLRWLHFKVPDEAVARFTVALRKRGIPTLRAALGKKLNISECYSAKSVPASGKMTLSCQSGMGFWVHRGIVLGNASSLNRLVFTPLRDWDRQNKRVASLLTLHGRRHLPFASCEFDPLR
jgi:hypothetical protein